MTETIEQGSPEWHAMRCGKATASRVADIMARTKTGWGASRTNYAAQLVAERLTGFVVDGYKSTEMMWGTEQEPNAKLAYAFRTNRDIEPIDFIIHPTMPMSGASPDGSVGTDGLIEIKCPNTATHIETLLGGSVPSRYVYQMQWQMACTGRTWCDFVSFDPRMPEAMRLFVQRLDRDNAEIARLEEEITLFLNDVEATVRALTKRYGAV